MRSTPPFSLLLPVYGGDRPDHLRRAFSSAIVEQTLRPDEVVIVRDGPVPDELAACLDELVAGSPVPVRMVPLAVNRGLGPALDRGLRECRHDIVARMDADDIAMPYRFEVQLPLMADADIVGSGLVEFSDETGEVVGTRTPPTGPANIAAYARAHDPFNHPSVVYRRSAIVAAGGYGDLPLMEDYWLFARMLAAGARAHNVPQPLIYYRVGATAYKRRGGVQLLRSEVRLQRQLRAEGFTSPGEFTRNVTLRAGYRLIPWWARRGLYKSAVAVYRHRGAEAEPTPVRRHAVPELAGRVA